MFPPDSLGLSWAKGFWTTLKPSQSASWLTYFTFNNRCAQAAASYCCQLANRRRTLQCLWSCFKMQHWTHVVSPWIIQRANILVKWLDLTAACYLCYLSGAGLDFSDLVPCYKKDRISVLEQQFHQLDVAQSLMLRKTASICEDSLIQTASHLIDMSHTLIWHLRTH